MRGIQPEFHGARQINMATDQVICFKRRRLTLICLSGLVWLTGGGGEYTIKSGQRIALNSSGKICVQAFEPSEIVVQQNAAEMPA
jgi:hypothetical protein